MKSTGTFMASCLPILLLSLSATAAAAEAPRNILWDGGLDTGLGNSFWGVPHGNHGPNSRDMWCDGVLRLKRPVATRIYWLEEGTYSLCAWVKRDPQAADLGPSIVLSATNLNYEQDKQHNAFSRKFAVPEGNAWQRVGWSFSIQSPVRYFFHVELHATAPVLVDAVSLTPGPALPEMVRPAADMEAGFYIPEETGIYCDGERRDVDLMIANHAAARSAKVSWQVYDHREDLVKEGSVASVFPARKVLRERLPLDDLPYGGYRLACRVEGEPVLGDALLAILPQIDPTALPLWGADANVNPGVAEFTVRLMQRLGMNTVNTLSCAGQQGRWVHCKKIMN